MSGIDAGGAPTDLKQGSVLRVLYDSEDQRLYMNSDFDRSLVLQEGVQRRDCVLDRIRNPMLSILQSADAGSELLHYRRINRSADGISRTLSSADCSDSDSFTLGSAV